MENRPVKVALVDDEVDFVEPVAIWLESRGYNVEICRNGREIVERAKVDPPDIVFMDINMPVLDGVEALEAIRIFNDKLPVIIVTSIYSDEEKMGRAKNLGISGFFSKNYTFDNLVHIIDVTLRTHKNISSNERAL